MPTLTTEQQMMAFSARKKMGYPNGCGFARCGSARCGASKEYGGIYQERHHKGGTRTIRMRIYRPTNPNSTAQAAGRTKFAAGMAAWQALTDEERAAYTVRAKRRNMFGWGLFMRDYMQSH